MTEAPSRRLAHRQSDVAWLWASLDRSLALGALERNSHVNPMTEELAGTWRVTPAGARQPDMAAKRTGRFFRSPILANETAAELLSRPPQLNAPAEKIFSAFVDPDKLTAFWLSSSSAPLEIGKSVHWSFQVAGAEIDTTATKLEPGRAIGWKWSDGTTVEINWETGVTVVIRSFQGSEAQKIEAALNATEGFALVLADLKTMLESGRSANIVRDKARLIELKK